MERGIDEPFHDPAEPPIGHAAPAAMFEAQRASALAWGHLCIGCLITKTCQQTLPIAVRASRD